LNKVSIIIPAYNAARFLGQTIESILCQTWQNWELIIIDDGSTDDTEKVAQPYLNDNRIIYRKQQNMGCSGAKNTGLQLATGDYIQYLDADDLLSGEKIAEQVAVLEKDPWTVPICRTKIFQHSIDEQGMQELGTDFLYTTDKTFEFILNLYGLNGKDGMIQPNAFLISRQLADAAGIWDTSISPAPDEDGEYFCRVMLKARSICFTPNGVNFYRKNKATSSLSKQLSQRHVKGALRSLDLKFQHLLNVENSERVRKIIATHYAAFSYLYYALYPEVSNETEKRIRQLGFQKMPVIGGRKFQMIVKLFGFKNALRLKKII
jgi:glycosyltransferase involved in cell wall biosynthesis